MEKMAKVVDNNDPEKLGKIKVRILPEMEDFSENILPWVGVYNQNDTTHSVPDNETFIRVVVEDWPYMQRIRYISDDFVEGEDSYSQFNANIEELSSQKYPQPSFKRYKDGTIVFHNSDTGEHGTYFSNGGYFLSDKDGNVHINSKSGKLSIKNDVISLREFFDLFKYIVDSLFEGGFQAGTDTVVPLPQTTALKTQLDLMYNQLLI